MMNFEFANPVKLLFGEGQIAKISNEIPKGSKILMTYGGGSIKKNGVYDQVIKALEGFDIVEFGGIEANPDYATLIKAVKVCKEDKIDCILAVGGGSIIDGSKFIAAAAKYDGDAWDLIVKQVPIKDALPLATVLTLPATASEMNSGGVISRRETKEKYPFFSPLLFPKFSVLDPTVIYSLPERQIINGVIDTYIHIVEQYLTTTDHYMVTDRLAEGILKNLIELSPALLSNTKPSYDTCANFMLTATMGLNGWTSMGATQDWATHMIGHELTALAGLDHAVTLAIVYPATMKVMRKEKEAKILQYAERVWGIVDGTIDERIDLAIAKTEEFFIQTGMKVRLSDHSVGQDVIDIIVKRFEDRGMNLGEGGIVTPAHVRMILEDRI
ncbi:MAG: iron-containing alcohol dehydrogenase [Marinifilaceae bacterium]